MTKILSTAVATTLLVCAKSTAAEGLRCTGEVTWDGMVTTVHLDIGLPAKIDATASVPSAQGSAKTFPVGRGNINIREQTGSTTHSRANDFYVTRLDTGIITGFFVEGVLVYVVRFSPGAKVFSYFDSFRESLIAGTCA
jgi:hypothetical protein